MNYAPVINTDSLAPTTAKIQFTTICTPVKSSGGEQAVHKSKQVVATHDESDAHELNLNMLANLIIFSGQCTLPA